ncbi:MAG: hypothetical protein FWD46_05420 [Cystobacterineae bacterium]|nr:hypothetical protein [Cystobacterineae bacterium]
MKTHAETKPSTPSRSHAIAVPNALAHQEQLRSALRRAGVQPRLEIGANNDPLEHEADVLAERVMRMPEPLGLKPLSAQEKPLGHELAHVIQQPGLSEHRPQAKKLQRQGLENPPPSGINIFGGNFSGQTQWFNGALQAKCQVQPMPRLSNEMVWKITVITKAPKSGVPEQQAELTLVPDKGKEPPKLASEQESPSLWSRVKNLLETETGQFLTGLLMGGLAGVTPGGFLVGMGGEVSGVSKEFSPHFRMGYGLGETAWGIAQIIVGLLGEAGGSALTLGGAGASATGGGAVVGVPAMGGGVVIISASAIAISEGLADVLAGTAVFMSAWNEVKTNQPASSSEPSPTNTPTPEPAKPPTPEPANAPKPESAKPPPTPGGGPGGVGGGTSHHIYPSIKASPKYPEGFRNVSNGTTKNNVHNQQLLDELRKIEGGKWQKVYKDGYVNGQKASIHYFESPSGKVFDVDVKWGIWSNRSSGR